MPKEVRLNDKIWFGKYRGRTIKDILDYDRCFLDTLLDKGKITYHKNVLDFLIKPKSNSGFSGYGSSGGGYTSSSQRYSDWSDNNWEPIFNDVSSVGGNIGRTTITMNMDFTNMDVQPVEVDQNVSNNDAE